MFNDHHTSLDPVIDVRFDVDVRVETRCKSSKDEYPYKKKLNKNENSSSQFERFVLHGGREPNNN